MSNTSSVGPTSGGVSSENQALLDDLKRFAKEMFILTGEATKAKQPEKVGNTLRN